MIKPAYLPVSGNSAFSQALLDPETEMPDGVIGPDGRPAPKRFNVYRNNVVVSLCEALGQTFPAISNLLGEDYFNALARAFIAEHPPTSPVLIWYGGAFAGFIEAFPPLAAYPYLADVARVEWSWLQAYHAADAEPMDPALLGAIEPDALGFVSFEIHPAVHQVSSRWPVLDLVRANRFSQGKGSEVDLSKQQAVLITRPDLDVEIMLQRPGGDVFLQAVSGGLPLAKAAAAAQDANEQFSLSDCLSDFLSNGVFTGLQILDETTSVTDP